MKFRSSSYLWKLMLLSVLVGTIPVILLGTFAYYTSSGTVQDKVSESNRQMLLQLQMRVEQTLRTIDNSATQLLQSPVVTKAFDQQITNRDFEMVHELYKGIAQIQTYELGIRDVFLFSSGHDWMISGSGVNEYSAPAFRPQLERFSGMAGGSFWASGQKGIPESYEYIYFVKKYPFNAVNPKGIICVVLSSAVVKEFDTFRDNELGSVFILDRSFDLVDHPDRTLLGSSMAGEAHLQPLLESQETYGQYSAKIDRRPVTVTYRKSAYNGWSYVSVSSNEQANEQNKIIGWITLLVCLGILLATLLLAWFGTRMMYRPIRSIYTTLAGIPADADTAKPSGELQVIGDRVDYLIRNQSLIMNELKGQQVQLKEYFMQKLLAGTISAADFGEKLSLYGIERAWPSMCAVAVEIDTLKDTRFEEANRDLLMFAISNIVGELVRPDQRLVPVVHSDCQVTLIGSPEGGAAFKQFVFHLCDEIQQSISQYLDIKASIGISRPFDTFADARQALHEAMTALKYRVGLGQESILFIEDVEPHKGNLYLFPHDEEQALFDAVRAGDAQQSRQMLNRMIRDMFNPNAPYRDYQMSLLRLLIDLLKFGQELSIPMEHIAEVEASLIPSLFKLRDVEEIENWFWSMFVHPYVQELDTRRDRQFKHISEAVIDMVRREFDSELTLEECASRINYHPHYVSRVFRQETGINFGEYVTHYRMEMAKKWLRESDMKIAEISERLQYNNSANFIRSFRKTVGMTPGQYREEG